MFSHAARKRGVPTASVIALAVLLAAGCETGQPRSTGPIVPGDPAAPREVNLIAKDYSFLPDALDLAPGETVLLHVINGGLAVHEAVIGDTAVQDAWEVAEATTASAPPGPTPLVSVAPGIGGLRIVVKSGERVDIVWTVPLGAPRDTTAWVVGCHIPEHWARGMRIPIRWAGAPYAS